MPRFWFTIRQMMVVVAIVAIAMSAITMHVKAVVYRERGHQWAIKQKDCYFPITKTYRLFAVRMERKYRRAARYPWLPGEPDPPEPD